MASTQAHEFAAIVQTIMCDERVQQDTFGMGAEEMQDYLAEYYDRLKAGAAVARKGRRGIVVAAPSIKHDPADDPQVTTLTPKIVTDMFRGAIPELRAFVADGLAVGTSPEVVMEQALARLSHREAA